MTEPGREPPDLALLAALDADLLDPGRAHTVRAAALPDPRSAAALAALAATRAELAALPTPAVPPGVAMRWAAALDAEAGTGPGTPVAGARAGTAGRTAAPNQRPAGRSPGPRGPAFQRRPASPRRHRRPLLVALLTGALIAAGSGLLARPAPSPEPGVLTFAQVDLAALGTTVVGVRDLGALDDPVRRAGCLAAVNRGLPGDPVLGGRRVLMDGRPGVLLVVGTGILGRFRLLVVDPACGPGGGTLLAETVVGR